MNPMKDSWRAQARFNQSGLQGRLGPSLLCLGRLLERRLWRALGEAELGLTPTQARTLVALHFHAPLTQQELAVHIDVEPSTLVGTLDVMEREGLARRDPNPSDRRAHLVQTTEKGEALIPRLFGLWGAVEGVLLDALSPREQEQLQKSLARLIDRLWAEEESC
jgi:MarR family transcriptional regulator for hemolysin